MQIEQRFKDGYAILSEREGDCIHVQILKDGKIIAEIREPLEFARRAAGILSLRD